MYQKSSGLTKFVIMFADLVCIAISLLAGDYLWHDVIKHIHRGNGSYFKLLLVMMGVYLVIFLFMKTFGEFYTRGFMLELWAGIKVNALLLLGTSMIMFFVKISEDYSRAVFGIFAVLDCVLMWIAHLILKKLLPFVYKKMVAKRNAIIVGSTEFVKDIIGELKAIKDYSTDIVGMSLTRMADTLVKDDRLTGIEEVAKVEELTEFCRKASVDEVIVEITDSTRDKMMPIMDELASAGIIIKYRTKLPELKEVGCQAVSRAGSYLVATYASRSVSTGNLLVKRAFDIFAGLVGSIITLIMLVFIAPAIKLESKGPILFKQQRVGRNGRIFTIYKLRSMYQDAEERKAELMKHNELDGLVFKMEDDPRITKVGKFLRKTSLDEFPQFFNVLKGDMSMVGTRPPTLDEFNQYSLNQKGRLSFRPGITGLWQVSGRNDIKNFDEIVALDKEYIKYWSPLYDLKIMLKTVPALFSGK